MVEIRDGKKVLITPISREDLDGIHIGDILYLDGDLFRVNICFPRAK